MRHREIADLPLAAVPVSLPPMQTAQRLEVVTRIVMVAMAIAFVFLAARIVAQF